MNKYRLVTVCNYKVIPVIEMKCMLLVEQGREMFVRRPNGSSSVSSDPGERYIRVPEHGVSNSLSYDMSATSALSSSRQTNVAAGGYPPVFPEVTSLRESGDDNGEPYIRLEDCYSGKPGSTLPVYSAGHSRPTMSPNKTSKQVRASAPINLDATNHFGDCAHHRVEYCNEYERGEHGSLFVSNCNYTKSVADECNDDDSDTDNDDYCHYQYPTVHYSTCHSVLSGLGESSSISEHCVCDPPYVNCSRMFDTCHNSRSELCRPTKRYGICCESVLTCPELPKLFCEQSSLEHFLSLSNNNAGMHTSASWNSCRFIPNTCKAAAVAADDDDDDDDDDDNADVRDYVNVPLFHSCLPSLL